MCVLFVSILKFQFIFCGFCLEYVKNSLRLKVSVVDFILSMYTYPFFQLYMLLVTILIIFSDSISSP